MGHFRVELNTIETTCFITYRSKWTAWCACSNRETFWNHTDFIAMTHPNIKLIITIIEITQQLITYQHINSGVTKFVNRTWFYFTTKLFRHGL